MRNAFPTEFVYQLLSLLGAFILVHAIYVAVIRPNADADMAADTAKLKTTPDYIPKRSYYVVVRDYEQEACFVLMLWALAILGYKGVRTYRQQLDLEADFIDIPFGTYITENDIEDLARKIQDRTEKTEENILPRILTNTLARFSATKNVQDASTVVHSLCESEAERLESELSTIRYIAWAIPSIGFIGTVRGIGDALAQAHRAVEGDITGVTQSLGVAFNSTFIALIISIVLMFIIHQIQLRQERLVLDTERYCDTWLLARLKVSNRQ
jgi:biopolymer transport protein ExbB/TolQ